MAQENRLTPENIKLNDEVVLFRSNRNPELKHGIVINIRKEFIRKVKKDDWNTSYTERHARWCGEDGCQINGCRVHRIEVNRC